MSWSSSSGSGRQADGWVKDTLQFFFNGCKTEAQKGLVPWCCWGWSLPEISFFLGKGISILLTYIRVYIYSYIYTYMDIYIYIYLYICIYLYMYKLPDRLDDESRSLTCFPFCSLQILELHLWLSAATLSEVQPVNSIHKHIWFCSKSMSISTSRLKTFTFFLFSKFHVLMVTLALDSHLSV